MSRKLLFEMIVEDLPPTEVDEMVENLGKSVKKEFETNGLDYESLKLFYTIRRFGFIITGIPEKQRDMMIERKGPSKRISFDENGKPTKALEGFLNSQKASINDIRIKNDGNGEYVFLMKKIEGKQVGKVLPDVLRKIINSLRFKKPMRWGDGKYEFVRPPHNVLCMLDDEVIDVELFDLKSSDRTYGLRFFGSMIMLKNAEEYEEKLRENFVIVFPDMRMKRIKDEIERFEEQEKLKVRKNEKLILDIVKICEYPKLIHGSFDGAFLNLPEEVIITTLEHHQKAFAVADYEGKLVNRFVVFQDRPGENENIIKGYERVINARLEDARFYFEKDLKVPLIIKNEDLKGMIFQKELGTLYDKVMRIEKISMKICNELNIENEEGELVRRSALLSKADIATNLVYEFPELQGKAGRIYSLMQGENKRVAYAIEEQYLPSYEDDPIPTDIIGAIIGLADRIDTIVGNFLIGNKPSGSKDPFGLRRKASGIIKIIEGFEWDIDLKPILIDTMNMMDVKKRGNIDEIAELFKARLESFIISKRIDHDIAKAVLNMWNMPFRAIICAMSLQKFRNIGRLDDVLIAFERPYNITKNHKSTEYDGALFKEEEERELFNKYMDVKEKIEKSVEHLNYEQALESVLELKPYIDRYFDNVFVMVGEDDLRLNRLGFLKELSSMFDIFGDLSVIERKNKEV